MSLPLVSAVVPFHGVEDFFGSFLDTLVAQTYPNFECILVDDGSPDGCAAIAQRYAEQDDRFVVVTQENLGPGPARNTGVALARGTYITFLDSDDLVAPRAFEQFVTSLEASGSDFAASNVWRLPLTRPMETSWAHREPFAERRQRTSIREIPLLMRDRMPWNKMWRRSFWDAQGYQWPAILFEDFPVAIRAHLEATAVDTLPDPTYVWRERATSISSLSASIDSVQDRVTAALMVLDTVDTLGTRELAELVHSHLVDVDLREVLAALGKAVDDADRSAIEEQARTLSDRVDPSLVGLARPQYQDAFRAARDGDSARLQLLARAEAAPQSGGTARRSPLGRGLALTRTGANRVRRLATPRTRSGTLTHLRTTDTSWTYRVRVPLNERAAERAHVAATIGRVAPSRTRTAIDDGVLLVELEFDTLDLATQGGYHALSLDIGAGPLRWQVSVSATVDQQHGVHRAGYWLHAVTRGDRLGFTRTSPVVQILGLAIDDAHLVVQVSREEGQLGIERPWPQPALTAPTHGGGARFDLVSLVAEDPADNPVTGLASRRIVVVGDTGSEQTRFVGPTVRTYAAGRVIELQPDEDGIAHLVHRPLQTP